LQHVINESNSAYVFEVSLQLTWGKEIFEQEYQKDNAKNM